jgi:hypothetical protein
MKMTTIKLSLCILGFLVVFLPLGVDAKRKRGPLPSQTPTANVPRVLSTAPGKNIKIGTWVEYEVTTTSTKKPFLMKIAFVGREDGGRQTWVEIALKQIGQTIYIKLLFNGKPGSAMGKAKKAIFKFGTLQAMEVPVEKAENTLPILFRKPIIKPRVTGQVDLRTKGGLFTKAVKISGIDADGGKVDIWNHSRVLLWGLLKFKGPRSTMTLIGQGFGARTRITEKPAPYSVPSGY